MSATDEQPRSEPSEGPRPGSCAKCESVKVKPHCDNPACPWARCECGAVTGLVDGKLHVMGAPAK